MTTKFYDRLSNDLTQLLEIPLIIMSQLKLKFDETTFNENNVKVLKMSNISVKVFNVIIKYIYSGTISLEKLENSIIFDLLTSSHELDLDELVEHLQTHLVTNNASWLKLNFAQIYQTCYQTKNLDIIQNFCNNIIAKHPNTIFESEKFISLPEDALISIIKLDDLQLDEDKIWDYVIQWGRSKNPTLPANLDEWTSDNFITLKTTLKNCLPHVRYFNISGERVLEKLWPYLQLFEPKLWYIYSGTISLEKLENSIIFDLLTSSHELDLDELVEHLQTHLVTNNASWLKLNFAQIYQTCYQTKNLDIIQNFCNNIIAKHPNTIFESEKFISLPEDALISIIKLDDLQLDEDKIWDYVIQWGRSKNPTLPANLDEWTSDNFITLKTTLKNCLPHVRYFNISGERVLEKLWPYLQLFEPKLWLDINAKFLAPEKPISSTILPPRKILSATLPTRTTPIPSIPSNIITNEHALELSSWIDRKETTYTENNPYEFKLLVRGSRDGFDVQTIFNICDKISNTIIVAKVEGTGEIIGGYNPLEIRNKAVNWYSSRDSFVFSLKTENLKNSIISRVTGFDSAIFYNTSSFFQFGNAINFRGNLKTGNESFCGTNAYEKSIRSNANGFSVVEFEVFKVSPKK
ncbi:hypothetical protein Glove_275g40 [Diversispora epigaea]|uniref:TLDc domain-containing protein n=1 Tax=Diversispora epigaea TaxID=1348612 RepID=A0A397IBB8_9GLOM|nr:hypothetical protein Glove_275g40 [Diversispora epigaea]